MAGIAYTLTEDVIHPRIRPFASQLAEAKRKLAYWGVHTYNPEYSQKQIEQYTKKIKVLENLIALYGPDPIPNSSRNRFVGIVYGETFDDPWEQQLPNEYEKGLYSGTEYGQTVYLADEWNRWTKYYVADGNGKYRFLKKEFKG